MNEHARKIFQRAFATVDSIDRAALQADIKRRDFEIDDDELVTTRGAPLKFHVQEDARVRPATIYKMKENGRPHTTSDRFEQFAGIIGEEVAGIENELRREIRALHAKAKKLNAELKKLRAELRSHNVTPLRGKDRAVG